jgi:hypothetical protein
MISNGSSFKELMVNLYYPAFLGSYILLFTMFVAMTNPIYKIIKDDRLYFGLILILYFNISYLDIREILPGKYQVGSFFTTLVIIVSIYFAFYFLGFFDLVNDKKNYKWFYLCAFIGGLFELLLREIKIGHNWNFLFTSCKYPTRSSLTFWGHALRRQIRPIHFAPT